MCIYCEIVAHTFKIVLWCNGSTQVFGTCSYGSNPYKTTVLFKHLFTYHKNTRTTHKLCGFYYLKHIHTHD